MKKLITANDIKKAHSEGKKIISYISGKVIITPEARDIANSLAIKLSESNEINNNSLGDEQNNKNYQQIESLLEEKIGPIESDKKTIIKDLIAKELKNFKRDVPECEKQINDDGIVLIRGNAVELDAFDGVHGKNIGLKDVIGSNEKSNMGVGYMGWEKASFPWHLDYDEVDVILEGELKIKTSSGITIGKPGDVIFIPKGSDIEFSTDTHVKFVYITYPADWS